MMTERIGTELTVMGGRLMQRLHNGRENLVKAQNAAADRSRQAARRTDYFVHENAWKMLGVAAGIAFAAGFIFSKRNQDALAWEARTAAPEAREKIQRLNKLELLHSMLPLGLFLYKAVRAARCARR